MPNQAKVGNLNAAKNRGYQPKKRSFTNNPENKARTAATRSRESTLKAAMLADPNKTMHQLKGNIRQHYV